MNFCFSKVGQKLSAPSGIQTLMDDLGRGLAESDELLMLGGGNPAHIPAMQAQWRKAMRRLLEAPTSFDQMLANYDPPQGNRAFIDALVGFLNREYKWNLTPKNIAITQGAQSAFFFLINLFTGSFFDGTSKKLLLPLCPEYIGYAQQGLSEPTFVSFKPRIEILSRHRFKYHIDFEQIKVDATIGAMALSRPTNPSGNVLTDREIQRLARMATDAEIPLIIDGAYGAPFPNMIFTQTQPYWNEHTVLVLSLSKLGLPGTRTGIVIACEQIVSALAAIGAVVGLANGNVGQTLVTSLLESGELLDLSTEIVRPFYEQKSKQALEWIHEYFDDDLDYAVHESEGALFLWLWLKGLPITSDELYARLKKRGMFLLPGCSFFYGLDEPWDHASECVRISYSPSDDSVRRGIQTLAEEVRNTYR